ncbi:L,D-transpeptidase, partial [Flavobacterium sp.]|uniref:L,D-transpeptidase n=1 Tax=Flavobacterium sp. TaxID=239 RepID=UPI003C6810F4
WLKANEKDESKMAIVTDLNRTDAKNIMKMDSIIVPTTFEGKREDYLPFPLQLEAIKNISKIIFFSYPTQTFAAYENGTLVYTGPTNMGREKDQTPTGLFFTNWKAEETTSTFNDEWDLKWNFNIENKLGVGFHQYELPGYPASHSCLRLQEKDARFLYDWADQWVLADKETVKAKGTPVIVFGKYDFKAPKPWLQTVKTPDALEISEHEMANLVNLNLAAILKEQKNSKLVAPNK